MQALGERTVILDCDVLQADGGTRTAAITGACAALALALNRLVKAGTLKQSPLRQLVAATSVGIVDDEVLLDLAYEEDSQAEVDMNIVMTEDGGSSKSRPPPNARPSLAQDAGNDGLRRSRHPRALRRSARSPFQLIWGAFGLRKAPLDALWSTIRSVETGKYLVTGRFCSRRGAEAVRRHGLWMSQNGTADLTSPLTHV